MSRSESSSVHGVTESPRIPPDHEPEPRLWVELGIDVGRSQGCPLGEGTGPRDSGTVQLVGTTCHITIEDRDSDDTGMRTISTNIDDECLCPSMCDAGLSPVEMVVDGGSLIVGAYATDRERIAAAIAQLEGKADAWRLRRLSSADDGQHRPETGRTSQPSSLNLTEKQREAVELAVEEGYYDRPRDASLGDLAERLDITRSALSQRLKAVESKLVTDLSRSL